jgi:hypothetical protein
MLKLIPRDRLECEYSCAEHEYELGYQSGHHPLRQRYTNAGGRLRHTVRLCRTS